MTTKEFPRQRGAVRFEYLLATIISVFLLGMMTVVIMVAMSRKAASPRAGADTPAADRAPAESPRPTPAPAPTPAPSIKPAPTPPSSVRPPTPPTPPRPAPAPTPAATGGQRAFPSGYPHFVRKTVAARIQAEDFDEGGEGISYHDTDAANRGGLSYRTAAVDLSQAPGGDSRACVSHIEAGEWLEYTIRIEQAGQYNITARTSRMMPTTGRIRILFNGIDKTGPITVPVTSSWQVFTSAMARNIYLPAGEQVMRVEMLDGSMMLNWIEISGASAATSVAPSAAAPSIARPPAPAPTIVLLRELFEDPAIGSRPMAGWSYSEPAVAVSVQESPGANGKCLRLVDNIRGAEVWAQRSVGLAGRFDVEFRFRVSQPVDGLGCAIFAGREPTIRLMTHDGKLATQTAEGGWRSHQDIKANTWYDIRLEVSLEAEKQTFNLDIDGTRVASNLATNVKSSSISGIRAETQDATVGTLYIDDLKITRR